MSNIVLLGVLIVGAASLVFQVVVWRSIRRTLIEKEADLMAFVSPAPDGGPSPLARATDAAASMFGRAVTAQLKTSLMGMESGAKRADTAVQADMFEGAAEGTPVAAVLQAFPGVRKSLRRNPQLLDAALQFIASRQGRGPGGNGRGDSPRFRLG